MTTLLVRFYGRFVFAESNRHPGLVTAIAVDPANVDRPPNRPAIDRHHVFMSVRERHLAWDKNKPLSTLMPSYRMMDGGAAPNAGHNLWDIAGYQVDLPGDRSFKWQPGAGALLADLNDLGKRPLKQKYLSTLEPGDVTTAIIRVNAGEGSAFQMTNEDAFYEYVPLKDPNSTTPDYAGMLADMVQVEAPFPNNHNFTVTVSSPQGSSTVAFTDQPPAALPSSPSTDVVLTFSNLCAESHLGPDVEFAAFYEILEEPPGIGDRKVPRPARRVQGIRPFGDCFINAKISY